MLSWYQGQRDGEEFVRQPLRPGERWQLTVRLKRPHGNANPHGFDYEAWLLERNIRATGYVRQNPPQRLDEMVWRPDYVVERLRLGVRDSFAALLPADNYPWAGILVALVVGDQRAIQGDLWTTFNRTGTTHLMSISGLHVTMVAALFGLLAGSVWRRIPALALRLPAQRAALLAGCLAAFFYVLLAGFAVPAQRTLYMLLVAALAMGSGRVVAPSRTLSLALLVVLLIDPWAVLAAGFWLSFGAVGALLYVGSAVVGEIRRLAPAHPQLGRRAVGGDAGLAAGSAAGLSAVFAGFAAGQRAGHPGRQLRRHAAGAACRRHSVVADRGAGACRARLADGFS